MRTFLSSYDELPKMLRSMFVFILYFASVAQSEPLSLRQTCLNSLNVYKSYFKEEVLDQVCGKVELMEGCSSVKGTPIFHLDQKSKLNAPKKILVMSLIHGDETHAGALGRFWMERLMKIDSRNSWRVIPVTNPDGVKSNTRANSHGVDLNRNFPTVDWNAQAFKFWESVGKKSNRKFPGNESGSEPEVKCVIKQIEDYQPDFVISIHTPLNVLDFDGPKLKRPPSYSYLPWRSLGNFPGSLGRYLWVERKTPVLTTELKDTLPTSSLPFEQLQDIIGTLVKTDLK
jgi:murein peptide amidase A